MPRYYFHLFECDTFLADEEGRNLPDRVAVRAHAMIEAREMMAAEVKTGRLCLSCRIEVVDEEQRPVLVLPFKEAVELIG